MQSHGNGSSSQQQKLGDPWADMRYPLGPVYDEHSLRIPYLQLLREKSNDDPEIFNALDNVPDADRVPIPGRLLGLHP